MKRGLIGKTLVHSFSKEIHELISSKSNYDLYSLSESELKSFLEKKDFDYVNVTIPYKEKTLEYVDVLSDEVKKIKALNLIVNRNNVLYGYNTDYLAFKKILEDYNISCKGKNVLVLGTGGTSKTVRNVFEEKMVNKIYVASRKENSEYVSYSDIYNLDVDIIVNTTPVGMFPNIDDELIDLKKFKKVNWVIDFIYNPLRTNLLIDAQKLKINCLNGLDILIYQALFAFGIASSEKIEFETLFLKIKKEILKKNNIVLIGMPFSGKTTIGKWLKNYFTSKEFYDVDEIIEEKYGSISKIFSDKGEEEFRKLEEEVTLELSTKNNAIIATGGGTILSEKNVRRLKHLGVLIFLDRDVDFLRVSDGRPLARNRSDLESLYQKRYDKYLEASDLIIKENNLDKCYQECVKIITNIK